MKTYWLTVAGLVALTLAVLIAAKVYWFTETTPPFDSKETGQIQEQASSTMKSQKPKTSRSEAQQAVKLPESPRWLDTAERKRLNPPPRLYQMPSIRNGDGKFTAGSLIRHPVINRQTSRQYTKSTQTKQVRELLRKPQQWNQQRYDYTDKRMLFQYPSISQSKETIELVRELRARHNRQHLATGKELPLWYLDSLKTKGAVEQVKPGLPGAELKLSEEQVQEIREKDVLHIIEQYKDNPKQTEKLREILLKRLKQFQKQRNASAKEKEESSE